MSKIKNQKSSKAVLAKSKRFLTDIRPLLFIMISSDIRFLKREGNKSLPERIKINQKVVASV